MNPLALTTLRLPLRLTVVADSEGVVSRLGGVLVGTLLVIVVMAVVFSILITRSITRPLTACVSLLESIGQGDLTREVPREVVARPDETGDLARASEIRSSAHRFIASSGWDVEARMTGVGYEEGQEHEVKVCERSGTNTPELVTTERQ